MHSKLGVLSLKSFPHRLISTTFEDANSVAATLVLLGSEKLKLIFSRTEFSITAISDVSAANSSTGSLPDVS